MKRNGNPGRNQNGPAMTQSYRDTVVASLEVTDQKNVAEFYGAGLLPGLATSAAISRTFVPVKTVVEFLPQVGSNQTQVFAQVQLGDLFMPLDDQFVGSCFPTQPTKLLSQVNPTTLVFDWRRAGKRAPSVLKPVRSLFVSVVDRSFLRILLDTVDSTPNISIALRITTWVDVFPQDEIVFLEPAVRTEDNGIVKHKFITATKEDEESLQ